MNVYIDESKAKGYVVAAASIPDRGLRVPRKELGNLVLPGQRSLHMKDERDQRKRQIADTIARMCDQGARAVVYEAGRRGTERDRRSRCLRALIHDVANYDRARLVFDLDETLLHWDRQRLIELARAAGVNERVTYDHQTRHQEHLLAIPDAIAWCWARGGEWRRRIRPIVSDVRDASL